MPPSASIAARPVANRLRRGAVGKLVGFIAVLSCDLADAA
jgi:hypothetical protein